MGLPTFETICRDLCAATGTGEPLLIQEESGSAMLSMRFNDVNMTLVPAPSHPPGFLLALAELGPVPADRELPALLALLDTNFLMRGDTPMSICCNPGTDHVVLQATYSLGTLTTQALYQSLISMSAMAHQWRSTFFLDGSGQPAANLVDLPGN
jgi:hypothetical protein